MKEQNPLLNRQFFAGLIIGRHKIRPGDPDFLIQKIEQYRCLPFTGPLDLCTGKTGQLQR